MSGRVDLSLILAMDDNRVIGHAGTIPWHHREDMRHFRRMTLRHAVIMGRGTYESMGRPLPKRRNIVISRRPGLTLEGCEVCASLDEAIAAARTTDPEPFVIGGAQIYAQALPLATRIYITEIPGEHPGDTFFPELEPDAWDEVERRTEGELVFVILVRRDGTAAQARTAT